MSYNDDLTEAMLALDRAVLQADSLEDEIRLRVLRHINAARREIGDAFVKDEEE